MLTGVSLTCFLFSYLIVLFLELVRLFYRFPARHFLVLTGMLAGLLAHTIFLGNEILGAGSDRLLNNWFQWVSLGAWGLALTCTVLMARNRDGNVGLFLIPMILILLGLAALLRGGQPFVSTNAVTLWGRVHGVSLLLGTMFICQGFAFGIMYLLQSHRLKSKRNSTVRFRLPALEFLRSMNRLNLFASTAALGVGLLSGILLNISREGRVAWLSLGVLVSIALFVWVFVASILEYSSKGSLGGRRSAYLSIANFIFLALVLVLVLLASHGQSTAVISPRDSRPSQFANTNSHTFHAESCYRASICGHKSNSESHLIQPLRVQPSSFRQVPKRKVVG